MEGNPLRGAVAEQFGSCAKLAKALNWSGRKTRDIVSGRQVATVKDAKEIAKALGIDDPREIMRLFF